MELKTLTNNERNIKGCPVSSAALLSFSTAFVLRPPLVIFGRLALIRIVSTFCLARSATPIAPWQAAPCAGGFLWPFSSFSFVFGLDFFFYLDPAVILLMAAVDCGSHAVRIDQTAGRKLSLYFRPRLVWSLLCSPLCFHLLRSRWLARLDARPGAADFFVLRLSARAVLVANKHRKLLRGLGT